MRNNLNLIILILGVVFTTNSLFAQTETGDAFTKDAPGNAKNTPRDDVYDRDLINERRILAYDHIREADVFWEKRIWRVIDVREKMNKTFSFPDRPLITIMMDAATRSENPVTVYSQLDDNFTTPMEPSEVSQIGGSVDTVVTYDEDYNEVLTPVVNDFNPDDVKQFRVKEVWFFDEETSTLKVRILGIAPIKDYFDDLGNFKFSTPMFWIYYPDFRETLAREESFNPFNDAQRMSWEDLFEMRYFSSYIIKESNVYDRRIEHYKADGRDQLLESDKIKYQIFNFEHDLWTY